MKMHSESSVGPWTFYGMLLLLVLAFTGTGVVRTLDWRAARTRDQGTQTERGLINN